MNDHDEAADTRETMTEALVPDLPEYAKPPVVEVAISVQFQELERFQPVHFGLLWELLRTRYPKTEHHPPLGSIIEVLGTQGPQQASLSVESSFPVGRSWFLSSDGLRLIQVQPDRLIVNWRKLETETKYPRYESLKQDFQSELGLFLRFLSDQQLGEFEPRQCELLYVNHLVAGQGWRGLRDLPSVLAPWSGETSDAYLPEPEAVRLAWQYRFADGGTPLGRMHVQFQSAVGTPDKAPLLVLQLTARGAPLGPGVDGVLAFTDRAHEWIVRGFTGLTTRHMHSIWERQR